MRVLEPTDAGAVADLHASAFGARGSRDALVRFLSDVFFGHPWRGVAGESLGFVDETGTLVGCLGVMPRPMVLGGAPLRVVVTHNFIMHPAHRSGLAAIQLLKRVLDAGPDLVLAEGNRTARTLCEALGGGVIESRSERWVKVLRPGGLAAHLLGRRLPRAVSSMISRVAAVPHALSPMRPGARRTEGTWEAADLDMRGARFAANVERHTRRFDLRPVYTPSTADWLLDCLRRTSRDQDLRARDVCVAGEIVGWYVYYSRPLEVGRVLQLGAREDARDIVLRHLVADASKQGNVALSGTTDPWWRAELAAISCRFRPGRSWLLAHARMPDLLDVLASEKAFLSRLEGEGWLRFGY